MLSPISLSLKTENTLFRINRLITLFLSLTTDTYKLSDDFVRFLWMLANSAPSNSGLSQPSSQVFADPSHESFAARVDSSTVLAHTGSSWGRYRESCSGPLRARQCGRWPPFPCFLEEATSLSTFHYLRSPSVPQTVLVCCMCFCMYARVL
jgi:hypothetical protein